MASQCGSRYSVLFSAKQTMQDEFNSKPKIQRVSPHLREGDKYTKYYKPKLISIGPIHHDDPNLKRGEQYKLMWAAMFVEQNGPQAEVLHQKVLYKIPTLRKLFSWDKIDCYNDEDLAFMLVVDGCSVIQILRKGNLDKPENLKIKLDQLILVRRDLLLLENQLPYELLELLVDNEMKLKMPMLYFCVSENMFKLLDTNSDKYRWRERMEKCFPSIHLLDCLRKIILNDGTLTEHQVDLEIQTDYLPEYMPLADNCPDQIPEKRTTYRTIRELKGAAIRVKKQLEVNLRKISFRSFFYGGELYLPPLILDESTVPALMNLVAYEMCPDLKNEFEISSYIKLLDLFIDHPEDVKELRDARILQNSLGSDEVVSKLSNTMSSELVQNRSLYFTLKNDIEKHYRTKLSVWVAEGYSTHFRSPWTVIGFLAASILLILTIIQTVEAF